MIYNVMKKIITHNNELREQGAISEEDYNAWAEINASKLDVFLLCNRISQVQYQELISMLQINAIAG